MANGTKFSVMLTEQVISQVNSLKDLYNTTYEDPESFDEVSSVISSTINDISAAVTPRPSDGDLDDLIQEIIRVVDRQAAEIQNAVEDKPAKRSKK